jgi:hypothetical protein
VGMERVKKIKEGI